MTSSRTVLVSCAAAVLTPVVLVSAAAAAPAPPQTSPGCVTRAEFRAAKVGLEQAQVRRTFGTSGRFGDGGAGGYSRSYARCDDSGCWVLVEFSTLEDDRVPRVANKRYRGLC